LLDALDGFSEVDVLKVFSRAADLSRLVATARAHVAVMQPLTYPTCVMAHPLAPLSQTIMHRHRRGAALERCSFRRRRGEFDGGRRGP
jgi:hypothetical protein